MTPINISVWARPFSKLDFTISPHALISRQGPRSADSRSLPTLGAAHQPWLALFKILPTLRTEQCLVMARTLWHKVTVSFFVFTKQSVSLSKGLPLTYARVPELPLSKLSKVAPIVGFLPPLLSQRTQGRVHLFSKKHFAC